MIDPAQFVRRGDVKRRHEVPHVESICAAGAGALLTRKPDFFFGDRGEPRQHRGENAPLWVGADGPRLGDRKGLGHWVESDINPPRDKPDWTKPLRGNFVI